MKILLAINPNHVEKIINGSKKYEYRTRISKEKISKILIYSTNPIKKVVAEIEVLNTLSLEPKKLWNQTKEYSGIEKDFFDNYFKNKKVAYAYEIGKINVFKRQKTLSEIGISTAPQSFCYVY